MQGRRRIGLVPKKCVEIFEVRMALFFDEDGKRQVVAVVSTEDDPDLTHVDLIELIGAIERGRHYLLRCYEPDE